MGVTNPIDYSLAASAKRNRDRLLELDYEQWAVFLGLAEKCCLEYYGFKTLREFVTAPLSKNGLSMTVETAAHLLRANPAYELKGKELIAKLKIEDISIDIPPVKAHGGANEQPDNVKPVRSKNYGNSKEYRIGRLKRDHPIIGKQLDAGRYKTLTEAEQAAGIKLKRDRELARFILINNREADFVEKMKAKLEPKVFARLAAEMVAAMKTKNKA